MRNKIPNPTKRREYKKHSKRESLYSGLRSSAEKERKRPLRGISGTVKAFTGETPGGIFHNLTHPFQVGPLATRMFHGHPVGISAGTLATPGGGGSRIPFGKLRSDIGPLYHGTNKAFKGFAENKAKTGGLYGPGVYFTDDPYIASSYSGHADPHGMEPILKGGRWANPFPSRKAAEEWAAENPELRKVQGDQSPLGVEYRHVEYKKPNVRLAHLKAQKIFDVEKHLDRPIPTIEAAAKFLADKKGASHLLPGEKRNAVEQQMFNYIVGHQNYSEITGHNLFSALDAEVGKKATHKFLRQLGYDAIRYDGGKRLGGPFHNAYVALTTKIIHHGHRPT